MWFVTNPCKNIGICRVFCYKGRGGVWKSGKSCYALCGRSLGSIFFQLNIPSKLPNSDHDNVFPWKCKQKILNIFLQIYLIKNWCRHNKTSINQFENWILCTFTHMRNDRFIYFLFYFPIQGFFCLLAFLNIFPKCFYFLYKKCRRKLM
jgi:hypothetical protein